RAVETIKREYERQQLCVRILENISWALFGEDAQTIEEARNVVAKAVAALPIQANWQDVEHARDQALQPFRKVIASGHHQKSCAEAINSAYWRLPFGMQEELKRRATESARAAVEKLP